MIMKRKNIIIDEIIIIVSIIELIVCIFGIFIETNNKIGYIALAMSWMIVVGNELEIVSLKRRLNKDEKHK